MQKFIIFISLFVAVIFLRDCGGNPYSFKEPIDEIESIEIISAENSLEFTVIKTLSDTEKEDFLEQFKGIKFYDYAGDPPALYGYAIKINYQSGIYETICHFAAEYVEYGVIQFRWRSCNEGEFNELLNTFLE